MTVNLKGNNRVISASSLKHKNKGYKYPDGLNLRPGSDLHETIINLVMDRAEESYRVMQSRHDSWNQISRSLSAYIRPEDQDAWKDKQKSSPIIVPVSYATLETILTYFVATFLDDKIFRYSGRNPEDEIGAILLQNNIAAQNDFANNGLALHTQWRDSFSYGFGATALRWTSSVGKRATFSPTNTDIKKYLYGAGGERTFEDYMIFEGNEIINIDPFAYLPDTNVPIHDVQAGEFVGWFERTNRMAILSEEKNEPDVYWNAQYLEEMEGLTSLFFKDGQGRDKKRQKSDLPEGGAVTDPVDKIHMYIDLVPSEHGLGKGKYPEKWKFCIAADSLVLEARPLGLSHNLFPITVAAPDFDGYESSPASRLEITYGLQDTIDWLFSSHVANVRKALNDMIIADPSRVNLNDLANPRAGRIIRTRRAYWGRGVEDVAKQLEIKDVTQGHMRDTAIILELIGRTSAASDMGQGIPMRSGERVSAEEVKGIKHGSLSRLAKAARIVSMQSMLPMARMMASHTQEFMSEDSYTKVTGSLADLLAKEFGVQMPTGLKFPVRPQDIMVAYDVKVHDGTMAGTEDANAWVQLFQIFGNSPQIAQQFDIVRIFKHIARQMGARNVDDFIVKNMQTQMMPDAQVQNEVGQGNLVPV